MKIERELHIMSGYASALEDSTVIRIDGRHSIKNIKVILKEEVADYYEILNNEGSRLVETGEILKLVEIDEEDISCPYLLELDCGEKLWFKEDAVKPSTKEAFEAQFKAKELTVAEIEEKLGYKIKIVK